MHICLLDIDGTLVLTGGAGQAAFAETLAADFGIPEIDTNVAFAGRSDRAIVADLFRGHGIEPSEANWQRFSAGYLGRLDAALVARPGYVLPGVGELLTALAARGDVALGLLTGNVREGARRKLLHYDLWHWFAFGGYGDEHMERCDIAAAALAAAKSHLNLQSPSPSSNGAAPTHGEVIVIGDTLHDISCGRSIGARCVAVATGHSPTEELRTGSPDVLLESLADPEPILALFKAAARRRVLVVDDNKDSCDTLCILLRHKGHEVWTARDGLEAVLKAGELLPEVILMDVGMPKLNGYEATKRIRETDSGRAMFIVALTGWGQPSDIAKSLEAGCSAHLVKPVDFAALDRLLASAPNAG